jgi:hypothetical protein
MFRRADSLTDLLFRITRSAIINATNPISITNATEKITVETNPAINIITITAPARKNLVGRKRL